MSNSVFCSVVIPVFDGKPSLQELVERTALVFKKQKLSYEIILVNDGSRDGSWEVIREISKAHPHVLAIDLLRNYGQHNAMHCGFKHAAGQYIITMDDDLQNPPEEIEKLIQRAAQGYDLVIGRYRVKHHSLYRKAGSRIIAWLNEKIFKKPRDLAMSNFRIIQRSVIERVLGFPGANPYLPGLIILNASRPVNVDVEHKPRLHGRSNYNVKKIAKVIFALLFSYSLYPLRALVVAGCGVSLLGFILAAGFFIRALLHDTKVQGWASIAVMISFFSGFIMLLLGILGEYILQITRTLNQPASYHIREIVRHA